MPSPDNLIDKLYFLQVKLPLNATRNDWYIALAYTVRDRMLDRYIQTGSHHLVTSGLSLVQRNERTTLFRLPHSENS